MGKKFKTSKFVQMQRYNQSKNAKSQNHTRRIYNQSMNNINKAQEEFNNYLKEVLSDYAKENNMDVDKIPQNSRILVYEMIKANINKTLSNYDSLPDSEKTEDLNKDYETCKFNLELINWVYNFTKPFEDGIFEKNDEEYYCDQLDEIINEYNSSLDNDRSNMFIPKLSDINNSINEFNFDNKDKLLLGYKYFCNWIVNNKNDAFTKYKLYTINVFKNMFLLNTEDPIIDVIKHNINDANI